MNHRTRPPLRVSLLQRKQLLIIFVFVEELMKCAVQVTTAQINHAVVKQVETLLLNGNALNQDHSVKNIFMAIDIVTVHQDRCQAIPTRDSTGISCVVIIGIPMGMRYLYRRSSLRVVTTIPVVSENTIRGVVLGWFTRAQIFFGVGPVEEHVAVALLIQRAHFK